MRVRNVVFGVTIRQAAVDMVANRRHPYRRLKQKTGNTLIKMSGIFDSIMIKYPPVFRWVNVIKFVVMEMDVISCIYNHVMIQWYIKLRAIER